MTLACALLAIPTGAAARTALTHAARTGLVIGTSGGSNTTTSTTTTSTPTAPTPDPVVRLPTALTATGDGITITVAGSGTTRHALTIVGTAPPTAAGGTIGIDIEGATTSAGQSWTQVTTATIGSSGAFTAAWVPKSSGQVAIRAVLAAGLSSSPAQAETGASGGGAPPSPNTATAPTTTTSALMIPIFKSAVATIFGPHLWGRHTACGQRLSRAMLGVASRTLKCGTEVELAFEGREITVPVVDRGPFANHASWDLTLATARALGVNETTTIGTLS